MKIVERDDMKVKPSTSINLPISTEEPTKII